MIDRNELIEHIPRLRRYGRLLTGDRDRADDLTQDTVARAISSEHTFIEGSNLRAWLFSIMHNLHIDSIRAKDAVDWATNPDDLPETVAREEADPVEMGDVRQAMVRLAPEYQQVLMLVAAEGLRYREAAAVLGVPIGTVMSRLARAREQMRALLTDEMLGLGLSEVSR